MYNGKKLNALPLKLDLKRRYQPSRLFINDTGNYNYCNQARKRNKRPTQLKGRNKTPYLQMIIYVEKSKEPMENC